MSSANVKSAWQRIRDWYEAHVTEPPVPDFFDWGEGASDAEIDAVEMAIGLKFPADLRTSYGLYNGDNQQWILGNGYLMPLSEVQETALMFKEPAEQGLFDDAAAVPQGSIRKCWWSLKWIPILHNAGGDYHCVDLDPASGGRKGQLIAFQHETGPSRVIASSFGEFLLQFADELSAGKFEFDVKSGIVRRISD